MEFLRRHFEEAIAPMVKNDSVQIGRFGYTGADILKLAGEDAYRQAFNDWIWDEWIPTRRDRKRELLKLDSNETRIAELQSLISTGRAIPFIGAGLSVPTGMPTWGKFLRDTCKKTKGFKVTELEALLASGDYEGAATRIFGAMPPQLFSERFETSFKIQSAQNIEGAIRFIPTLFDSHVITTNFDEILETVFEEAGRPFNETLYGTGISEFRMASLRGARCLLKLHGTYKNNQGRVLLKEEYDDFYASTNVGCQEFSHLFKNGGMVFLGCSLAQDRTMALFKKLADDDKNIPRNYALLQRPKKNKLNDREHYLTERNIFPIWYDGDHGADVEAFLVGIMEDLKRL